MELSPGVYLLFHLAPYLAIAPEKEHPDEPHLLLPYSLLITGLKDPGVTQTSEKIPKQ